MEISIKKHLKINGLSAIIATLATYLIIITLYGSEAFGAWILIMIFLTPLCVFGGTILLTPIFLLIEKRNQSSIFRQIIIKSVSCLSLFSILLIGWGIKIINQTNYNRQIRNEELMNLNEYLTEHSIGIVYFLILIFVLMILNYKETKTLKSTKTNLSS
ncbi:MAG: hypothetical protein HRT69_18400 [Flavobacteriaceae bacterium]|nr:hypothetical protein [Flavobacteriaceae bacterium]